MQTSLHSSISAQQTSLVSKPDYPFVNWIRFVAMVSIVYEHSLVMPSGSSELALVNPYVIFTREQAYTSLLLSQPLKFGTICFFIISGFLLGKNLKYTQSPWKYYKRRLKTVGIPFIIAFSLFYLKSVGFGFITGKLKTGIELSEMLATKLFLNLFGTTYWFMVSFLSALGFLFIFWQYTRHKWFGWLSGCITLLYAINIYTNWFEPRHIFAVPAFVFYLWLGVWLAHIPNAIDKLSGLSNTLTNSLVCITGFLALCESYYLLLANSVDPANSLRLTNQLFSMAVFIWLINHNYIKNFTFLNPREESFGIYLYHLFGVAVLTKIHLVLPGFDVLNYNHTDTGIKLAMTSTLTWLG